MAIAGLIKVVAHQSLRDGEVAVNSFHFLQEDAVTEAGIGSALAMVDGFYTAIRDNFSNQWSMNRFVGTDESGGGEPAQEVGSSLTGTGDSSIAPLQLAMCVSLRTGVPGRQNRGRIYLGGFMSGAYDGNGRFVGSVVEDVGDTAESTIGTPSVLPVVALAVKSSVGAGHAHPVTSIRIGEVPDTIRRRRNKLAEAYHVWAL